MSDENTFTMTDWVEFTKADDNNKILIYKNSIESIQEIEVKDSRSLIMLTTKSGMSYDITGSYAEIMERI